MKVSLPKKPGLQLSVHLSAKGEVMSVTTGALGVPASVVVRPLKSRRIGAVAGTLLALAGGASKGAAARNKSMSSARRKEIAIKAAAARWKNK